MKSSAILLKDLMEENSDEFKKNCHELMTNILYEKSLDYYLGSIETIFKEEKNLHSNEKEEIDEEVFNLLQTSIKQNHNIMLVLEDNREVVLHPSDATQIFKVFDVLNEQNQIKLINNLIKSKSTFNNTLNFCSYLPNKERF